MTPPKAKKHFGQHFLTNPDIAQRMADQLQGLGKEYRDVLEIGPGKGILTQALLRREGIRLWPVEVDQDMVAYLRQACPSVEDRLVQTDFLSLDLKGLVGQRQVAVTGNFPYNISSQIVFKILDHVPRIPELVGMFQKEVAERIVAEPGSKTYGILSVLVRSYYHPSLLFKLKPGSFNPPPKVQSAVIKLERHTSRLADLDEALYFRIVKTAFNQRRKKMRNSIKNFVADLSPIPEEYLEKRAEALTPLEFQEITRIIEAST